MRLNLGCGRKKMHGFVNIDIRPEVNPDVVDDVFLLDRIEDESVDLVYACHVLEHSSRDRVHYILSRWREVLKPGGMLRVCVPDLRAACEYYLSTHNLDSVMGLAYGGQRNEWDFHRVGFDEVTLTRALTLAGFRDIRPYDWRTTDHSYVDDYSMSMLPRVSYFTRNPDGAPLDGKAVSLNLEAVK